MAEVQITREMNYEVKEIGTSIDEQKHFKESKVLRNTGITILVLGIIVCIIMSFTIIFSTEGTYYKKIVFNPAGLAYTVLSLLSSIITWALFNVLSNISNSLTKIVFDNKKTSEDEKQ